jgi:hypothetical protein
MSRNFGRCLLFACMYSSHKYKLCPHVRIPRFIVKHALLSKVRILMGFIQGISRFTKCLDTVRYVGPTAVPTTINICRFPPIMQGAPQMRQHASSRASKIHQKSIDRRSSGCFGKFNRTWPHVGLYCSVFVL